MHGLKVAASTIVALLIQASALPALPPGDADAKPERSSVAGDLIPIRVESYPSSDALAVATAMRPDANHMWGSSPPGLWAGVETKGGGSGGGRYLPLVFSALVPGTGEIYLGFQRDSKRLVATGAALVAMEVVAWTGYFYYDQKGLDSREEYEAFADRYWDEGKWLRDHPTVWGIVPEEDRTFELVDSIGSRGWNQWPGYHSYAAKDEEKQNYYENIGKYDWFISGWADWDPALYDPISGPRNTSLRDQYRALRKQSNDELDTSKRFVYLSVAARVFSIIHTAFLVKGGGDGGAREEGNELKFTARSTGIDSGEFALEYHF